jgi:hypothetical protein
MIKRRELLAATAALVLLSVASLAHPLPDSTIVLAATESGIAITIEVPLADLLLALPRHLPKDGAILVTQHQVELKDYFSHHMAVRIGDAEPLPLELQSMTLEQAVHVDVGPYALLKINGVAVADKAALSQPWLLAYDAVMHQVPNHGAQVSIIRDGANDILAEPVGIIRFDYSKKLTPPLLIQP